MCRTEGIVDIDVGEPRQVMEPVTGPSSILLLDGERHMRMRKLMLPPFHGEAIAHYAELIEQIANREIDGWRPGDVIRHFGGRTSEVRNTDAEGRLVMADALAYAVSEVKPDVIVDVATLTGAMKVALGQRTGGFFSSDDALADLIATAGAAAGEPLWRMPLVEDYEERLESKVADADNAAGGPGAITAALFLRHFTGGLPWAHLDIASVGDSPVDAFEWTSGATGFGARALLHWLELREPLAGVTA